MDTFNYDIAGSLNFNERLLRICTGLVVINGVIYTPLVGTALFPLVMALAIAWALTGIIGNDPLKSLFEPPRFHESTCYRRRKALY